jgi:1-acyl-sn-glycerol-3-phosphate acyltransferase
MKTILQLFRALRFLLFNIFSWLAIVPFTVLVLLAWPLGHRYSYIFGRMWAMTVLWLARWICGLSYRVVGTENIPATSSVYFLKHSSAFETFSAVALFPRNCWVLKKELLWVPFFGWTLLPLDSIAIDRTKGTTAVNQVIKQCTDRLQRKINVVVFPEGTRMPFGTTKRYGISGTLLAQQSGSLIVPVAHNSGYYWPRRGFGILPGEVTVVIGKPIDPAGRDAREINTEIQAWVEATISQISKS